MNQVDLRARFRPSVRSLRSAPLLALAAMYFVPHAAAAAVPIKICFVDDRSGAAADTGKLSLEGVELAIDQFNAAGGANGHKAQLVAYDGKTDPQLSATYAQRCAEDDHALLILGGDPTAPAAAMIPIAEDNRIPLFILAATADRLTQPVMPYVFRFGPDSTQEAQAVADLLATQQFKRVALVACSATSGIDYLRAITAALDKRNIPIVIEQTYDINAVDLSPQLANVRNAKPDVVVVIPYPADGARVLRTAQQLGMSLPTVVVRTVLMETLRKLAGDASDGVVTPNTVDISRADVKLLFSHLDTRYGPHQPTLYSVISYDAARVALAIASQPSVLQRLEAGDIAAARQNFRDDVERIGTFEGVQGRKGATYRFTARNHQGPAGDNWYVYTQVTEKGTRLVPANLNTFSPKK
jgi:branched-chain amino acid transport system substrate-binding protein